MLEGCRAIESFACGAAYLTTPLQLAMLSIGVFVAVNPDRHTYLTTSLQLSLLQFSRRKCFIAVARGKLFGRRRGFFLLQAFRLLICRQSVPSVAAVSAHTVAAPLVQPHLFSCRKFCPEKNRQASCPSGHPNAGSAGIADWAPCTLSCSTSTAAGTGETAGYAQNLVVAGFALKAAEGEGYRGGGGGTVLMQASGLDQ